MNIRLPSLVLALTGITALVAQSGCQSKATAQPLGPHEFEVQINRILDDDDTKVIALEATFQGEQRVGSWTGRDRNYVTAGYDQKPESQQAAQFLIFAHQTIEKNGDDVIRKVSFSVMPSTPDKARAGGMAIYSFAGAGHLEDELKLKLPEGRFPLGHPVFIGTFHGADLVLFIGSATDWKGSFGE